MGLFLDGMLCVSEQIKVIFGSHEGGRTIVKIMD